MGRLGLEIAPSAEWYGAPMTALRAALFDLDGVLRHFPAAQGRAVARAHGVALEDLAAVAFEPALLRTMVTGGLTRADWVAEVGRRSGHPAAANAWLASHGELDPAAVAVVDELVAAGIPVGLLTNGTDTIPAELRTLGLADRFDAVINSWAVGVAKPEAGVYLAAAEALGLPCEAIAFTDDREENVAGARAVGMGAHRFRDPADLRAAWLEAGLPLGSALEGP